MNGDSLSGTTTISSGGRISLRKARGAAAGAARRAKPSRLWRLFALQLILKRAAPIASGLGSFSRHLVVLCCVSSKHEGLSERRASPSSPLKLLASGCWDAFNAMRLTKRGVVGGAHRAKRSALERAAPITNFRLAPTTVKRVDLIVVFSTGKAASSARKSPSPASTQESRSVRHKVAAACNGNGEL